MGLTMQNLINMVETAKEEGYLFIGIKINMDGFEKDEVIINPRENFDTKLAYYIKTYDENLIHKFSGETKIRISGFTYGETFDEIEGDLIWNDSEDDDLD